MTSSSCELALDGELRPVSGVLGRAVGVARRVSAAWWCLDRTSEAGKRARCGVVGTLAQMFEAL
jgi:hypothetical protein